jgi:hypothetical protein
MKIDWSHPDDVTQEDLHRYRAAAEQAWGDDTRHPNYVGHPNPSFGQCYVTSRWLTTKLGGHVATKDHHYVWMSPDKTHVIDLTGDQFGAIPPEDPRWEGLKLDDEDEGWHHTEDQKTYRPGPIIYKPATHPLYAGSRVKTFKTENPRVKLFRERADAALENL